MPGLCAHIATLTDSIVGFDFPFSIPAPLIEQSTWPAFIRDFAARYATPEEFRETCRSITGGRELKRETDIEAKVPWCAYNLRLYRQTWAGIRHVLAPLVSRNFARIIPIQPPKNGLTVIVEICPASFLKARRIVFSLQGTRAGTATGQVKNPDRTRPPQADNTCAWTSAKDDGPGCGRRRA